MKKLADNTVHVLHKKTISFDLKFGLCKCFKASNVNNFLISKFQNMSNVHDKLSPCITVCESITCWIQPSVMKHIASVK